MVTLKVTGLDVARAGVKGLPKQANYALSVAVNETAKVVQGHTLRTLLPSKFTLRARGAPWQDPKTPVGFKVKFAKQSSRTVNPQAIVGSRADWLPIQEEGGVKDRPKKIAIPTEFHKLRQEILARAKRPKAIAKLMQRREEAARKRGAGDSSVTKGRSTFKAARRSARNTPFHLDGFNTASGHSFPGGWWVRTSKERLPIRPLFFFHETTKVPARLQFIPTETALAHKELTKQFRTALNKALTTAKK